MELLPPLAFISGSAAIDVRAPKSAFDVGEGLGIRAAVFIGGDARIALEIKIECHACLLGVTLSGADGWIVSREVGVGDVIGRAGAAVIILE